MVVMLVIQRWSAAGLRGVLPIVGEDQHAGVFLQLSPVTYEQGLTRCGDARVELPASWSGCQGLESVRLYSSEGEGLV